MKLTFSLAAAVLGLASGEARAATFTVTNLLDSGSGSLRQAILDANGASGEDTITFSVSGTITLASALPPVTDSTTIQGPGTNLLTVSGNNSVKVFTFDTGTTSTISGLTIANGLATSYANGAGIANAGVLTILGCMIMSNTNRWGWGGGIFNSGDLMITTSLFSMNNASGENGADQHGASSLDGVNAGGGAAGMGGAIFSSSGTVTISASRFHGNTVIAGAGGTRTGLNPCLGSCTGRGGGIQGGANGGRDSAPGGIGGFGCGGGAGGWHSGSGGRGGFGGGGGGSGGLPGAPGTGGFSAGSGSSGGGNGGGGGAGLGATIFVDTGTLTLVDSIISGSHAIGGSGGPLAQNGYGVLGSIFNLGGTIHVQNTGLSLTTTNTTFQHWTNANLIYRVPKGTPKVFINDELAIEDVVTRTPVQVALQNGFSAGTMVYSLTGTDPRFHSTLYTGPFTVNRSALLRVLSYDSNFAASVEIDSIQITVLPTLNATTAGGGTISVQPVSGPYISNRFAQVVAQPAPGCTFLQWLGDASSTNPTTTV